MQFTENNFVQKWYETFRSEFKEDGEYSESPMIVNENDIKQWCSQDWVTLDDIKEALASCATSDNGYYIIILEKGAERYEPADFFTVSKRITQTCYEKHECLKEDVKKVIMDKF